jgi:hypothetical protein
MPASLLAGGVVKVLLEQPALGTTVQAEWLGAAVVPQAHLVGAVCGGLLGVLFATANARAERQHRKQ